MGVVPSLRVSLLGPFLVITEVQAGDQGVYACVASNSAGVATASGTLTIFGKSTGTCTCTCHRHRVIFSSPYVHRGVRCCHGKHSQLLHAQLKQYLQRVQHKRLSGMKTHG